MDEQKTYTRLELEELLNERQKHFCHEFLWNNRVQSYLKAYPDCEYKSASASATRLLDNARIKQYIAFIKNDIEELTGVSKIKNVRELAKIAYSNIENIHDTWIELKDWCKIKEENPKILAAIESIDTKTETKVIAGDGEMPDTDVEVNYVKIKLYPKITAIQEINKMMGYNAPEKIDNTSSDGSMSSQKNEINLTIDGNTIDLS